MKRLAAAAALMVAANAALAAGPLDGRWSFDAEFCASDAATDAVPVVIVGNEIRYYESVCKITDMVAIGGAGSAWRVLVSCRGEGEAWQRDLIFALDRDTQATPRQLVEIDMKSGDVSVRQSCD